MIKLTHSCTHAHMHTHAHFLFHSLFSSSQGGIIHFGGTTEFAAGQWAGVELDEPTGKNDGSYMGIRYFTCKPKYAEWTRGREKRRVSPSLSLCYPHDLISSHSRFVCSHAPHFQGNLSSDSIRVQKEVCQKKERVFFRLARDCMIWLCLS